MERNSVEIRKTPRLQNPSLIVSWQTQDIGKLGSKVADFLVDKLGGEEIAEMNPSGFFTFGGVRFRSDLVVVPESKFWACEGTPLLIFRSDEPAFEHFRFLSALLDFAEYDCQVRELYTLSGTLSLTAHTRPRRIPSVFSQSDFQESLRGYGLEDMTWEGPPAISSYLLWVAKRRGLPGASLWPEIPFYLAAGEDPQAVKATLSFLDRKFRLGLDLKEIDLEIIDQNEKISRLRKEKAEIDQHIRRLEDGLGLDEEEQMILSREVYETLKQ